jgi:hypothetical protein
MATANNEMQENFTWNMENLRVQYELRDATAYSTRPQ